MAWRTLGAVSPRDLSATRKRLHRSVQWLARIARSYYSPVDDDSHTALAFDPEGGSTALPPIDGASGSVTPSFIFKEMALSFEHGANGLVQAMGGLDEPSRERAVRSALSSVGLTPDRLSLELPYADEVPDTDDAAPSAGHAEELVSYYANIHECLAELTDVVGSVSPTRLWPHHFDMVRLITLDDHGDPEERRSIGVGLAPDDSAYDQPYLYIAPWPPALVTSPPPAPTGLRWHREGFTALVATADKIMLGPDAETRVRTAITESVALCRALLRETPRS